MRSFRKVSVFLLTATLMATAASACSKEQGPDATLKSFLDGWAKGDVSQSKLVISNGEKIEGAKVNEEIKALSGTLLDAKPEFVNSRIASEKGNLATGEVTVRQPLPNGLKWEYPTTIKLSKAKDGWQVIWEPTVIHPQLTKGDKLDTRRINQARGPVLGAGGEEIVTLRPVVVVGIWPAKATGPKDKLVADMAAALAPVYTVDNAADLRTRINDPKNADQFVEVVTLRQERYIAVKPQLQALSGAFFREEQRMLAETTTFASAVLGRVGPVTKEIMDANPGVYSATDLVGQGGLQQKHDQFLRGTPGIKVVIARKAPDGTTQDTVLHTIEPKAGSPLKTTLDLKTQRAAEAALEKMGRNSSLVAIKVSDGSILAAANHKVNYNMAFTAQVPPGSTFKAVTALGLLDAGKVTADTGVACPQELTVPGRPPIHNAHNFSIPGSPTFKEDFARSCNTAFASLAPQLGGDGLAKAGAMVGLGQKWDLGLDVDSGKVSQNGDPGEQAAAAFGQGTTVVSPVAMAGVAAAIARGQWKQPKLVYEPAPSGPAPDGPSLKSSTVDPLRQMMKLVVSSGTASSLSSWTGLHGKTGTAEYVTGDPDKTHAWFIGWNGDVAFAVFVEQGGAPADTALPITDAFLKGL
ncbi:MAG TPA: penicillin-binding transpeptidase domain-containing protein [Candidatus Limnocylindrales bacterium]|nr:penicillin-binding transpeptidase domain-containing protein [Candidatus Limnocylindrales bacterium]